MTISAEDEFMGRCNICSTGTRGLLHQSAALHTDGKSYLTSHLLQGADNLLTPAGLLSSRAGGASGWRSRLLMKCVLKGDEREK